MLGVLGDALFGFSFRSRSWVGGTGLPMCIQHRPEAFPGIDITAPATGENRTVKSPLTGAVPIDHGLL